MILLTNGCSWTYGGSLGLDDQSQTEQRLSSVWPHHLGTLLGAEKTVNLADGCGSNQRSVRTTYNWILSQSKEVLENTVAVIQFTEPSRYELYVPFGNSYNDSWLKCKAGVVTSNVRRPDLTSYHWDCNDKRLSLYSDEEGAYVTLTYCEALASLFKKHGVKYYFWSGGFFNHDDIELFDYKKKIGLNESIPSYFKEFNWFDCVRWHYDRVGPNDAHPSFEGHKEIAKLMFDNMT